MQGNHFFSYATQIEIGGACQLENKRGQTNPTATAFSWITYQQVDIVAVCIFLPSLAILLIRRLISFFLLFSFFL
ncbi:hypothetical protein I7I50_09278 [Histoplasma capsulatum G186AR]|uniref:Transmembrane protein n=1 Tax=Ajellomyces capsulatus TaxID=5037 RepID=A0A8H8CZI4_AJECA|nr:hypothetical protein I7I52_06799 [Histoplasma capsulatum]QSS74203.1 hypothetical protein I7I50_09278 [Histoplasma capsulatum G186AR]